MASRYSRAWGLSKALAVKILLLVLLWWTAAVAVTLQMKSMLGKGGSFPFSFALTGLTNTLTGVLACLLAKVLRCWQAPMPALEWGEVVKLTLIGAIQGLEYACNNKSLEYLSVSGRTMASSMMVLFMMVTARAWGLEHLDTLRMAAAALIGTGGALQGLAASGLSSAARAETDAYFSGLLLQLTAMLAGSQRWALLQHVTQRSQAGSALAVMAKSKLHLVQRTLPVTGVTCLLLSAQFEGHRMPAGCLADAALLGKVALIASGIVALTVAELEIVRATSAVAILVLGSLHQIPITIAGVLFFHETVRLLSGLGFGLCLLGGLCYVRARCANVPPAVSSALHSESMGVALVPPSRASDAEGQASVHVA